MTSRAKQLLDAAVELHEQLVAEREIIEAEYKGMTEEDRLGRQAQILRNKLSWLSDASESMSYPVNRWKDHQDIL
jgi:hypothetical protein